MSQKTICGCCYQPTEQPRCWYCYTCFNIFTEFIKPFIKQAKRRIYTHFTHQRLQNIKSNINFWECSFYLHGGNEDFQPVIMEKLLTISNLQEETVTYKHVDIKWKYCDTEETYFGEQYSCYFKLDNRLNSLYKRALFAVLELPFSGLERLHGGIIDDLIELDILYSIRYLNLCY
jgi:hypothetical protein